MPQDPVSTSPHPTPAEDATAGPVGVNHIVLNVRHIGRSHTFWTDVLGFRQVGALERTGGPMRFYAGRGGNHHDIALMELAAPADSDAATAPSQPALNHVAIEYGDQESWLAQLRRLQAAGVAFQDRINHGTSHSVYVQDPDGHGVEVMYSLPPDQWQGDINAALNHLAVLPRDGDDALADPQTPHF